MSRICVKCGKTADRDDMLFCPYCGSKLVKAEKRTVLQNKAATEWIQKAMRVTSLPERKKILEQAKKACPDDPEIDWELLFIGTPDPKPPRGKMDFSIIKSWLLQIYRTPGDFSTEKKNAMRRELFEGQQLQTILEVSENPEGKMQEYLLRLCREYIDIFLKEDNRLMGNLFGFRIGRNRTKALEDAVAGMLQEIEADEQLTPEQKAVLRRSMLQAFDDCCK